MRDNKIVFTLLIVLIVIIVVALAFFGIKALGKKGNDNKGQNSQNGEMLEAGAPILELSLSATEPDQDEVFITATATPGEGDEGINYILLPDKTRIYADTKDYVVTENGTYKFQAVGLNGVTVTEEIEVTNIKQVSSDNPYIPEGFEEVGGEIEDGYVIQDSFGNQYVWVPVPSGILTRDTMMSTDYAESNSAATALVNSVAKNYGFYIARFEASSYEKDGVRVGTSVGDKIPWTDINFRDAETAAFESANAFGYEGVATSLMSSYAWDTTLKWIEEKVPNYSSNTSYGNYSGTIYPTGSTESDQMNHICDLAGNVREWTTEEYSKVGGTTKKKNNKNTETGVITRVVRGGSANLNKIASSRNGYDEELKDEYWGFRLVLYKI